jgi:Zn-dependent protease
MADRLGDPTAKSQGRLTLNPLRHLDLFGCLFLVFAGFGWAKPVVFNPGNLAHPRRDRALIAAAGPVSNLLLAAGLILVLMKFAAFMGSAGPGSGLAAFVAAHEQAVDVAVKMVFTGASVNLGLFVFNLIPLPPLDGSHIVFCGLNLPPGLESALTRFGAIALVAVLIIENQTHADILPIGKMVRYIVHLVFPHMGT